MNPQNSSPSEVQVANPYSGDDVAAILRERGWLNAAESPECVDWLRDAAALLGPHAPARGALCDLLRLVFHYDARAILQSPESHLVLAREGAREVIRELALQILEDREVDSDRFKEIIEVLKSRLGYRGRELFYPIRLALAGRAGEGDLDRVILLLDRAARLPFAAPVKGCRRRMLEFCSALD